MNHHVMCDLETLGTVPGCVGLSVGLVEFHPEENRLGSTFYSVIDVDSSLDHYLREDPDTVAWWDKQSEEAQAVVRQARGGEGLPLPRVMEMVNGWLSTVGESKDILFYGNGADFDNPIVRVMYDAAKVKPYAAPFGGRCYRTLKNLHELFGPTMKFHRLDRERHRVGTHHNALDDAKSQALHLMENVARIRGILNMAAQGEQ